jgi:hypothetical protein
MKATVKLIKKKEPSFEIANGKGSPFAAGIAGLTRRIKLSVIVAEVKCEIRSCDACNYPKIIISLTLLIFHPPEFSSTSTELPTP